MASDTPISNTDSARSPMNAVMQPRVLNTEKGLYYMVGFCPVGKDPYDMVEWKRVDTVLKDKDDNIIFEQRDVDVPATWSDRAVRIVAQKYFHGKLGTPEREYSVKQLIGRVVNRICVWAHEQHYFASPEDLQAFCNDLIVLLLTQRGAFNSPVWFNLGIDSRNQQVSACFINSVEDNMDSIAELQTNETVIFKQGSGSGVNLSNLRGSMEHLSGGGIASGPVSFMRGYDSWAGIIKSGGGTRRAAAMRILNCDHPDILEFIDAKLKEEEKAQKLIAAGFSADFDDPNGAYAAVHFQNANHSVRVTDVFMQKVKYAHAHLDEYVLWDLVSPTDKTTVVAQVDIRDMWGRICAAAWACGDPGLQFDTVTNAWNTCASDGRINGSNPCSEFTFLDDSACNLASLNLMQFRNGDGSFDEVLFRKAVQIFVIAQDVLINNAFYPTQKIGENSKKYRPLGLGYANLGAYLMSRGLPTTARRGGIQHKKSHPS